MSFLYRFSFKYCLVLAVGLCLAGCARFPVPERGAGDVELPDDFVMYAPQRGEPDRWWESFDSDALDALVETALEDNFSLAEAAARVEQSFAIARQRRSSRVPQLNYSAGVGFSEVHRDAGFGAVPPGNLTEGSESYSVGLGTAYEVDLWGRLRGDRRAAVLDAAAFEEDLYAAKQSIAGLVATVWLDLLEVRQALAVTHDQIETNQRRLGLIEFSFRKGSATGLDVAQQRQLIARTQTLIPPLELLHLLLSQELAVLLGKVPGTELELGGEAYPVVEGVPEVGIPADLLGRRPDVRAAGLRLQSADWRVSVARADRLPALSLVSAFSFNGDDIDILFDNWLATLAGSVTGPIFDGGRRKFETIRTQAVVNERLSQYRRVVLTAIQEVEGALARMDRQQAFIEALKKQYEAGKSTHLIAENRYEKGLIDYLPVLTALLDLQNLERSIVDAEHDLLVHRVRLYLALGGHWMREAALDGMEME